MPPAQSAEKEINCGGYFICGPIIIILSFRRFFLFLVAFFFGPLIFRRRRFYFNFRLKQKDAKIKEIAENKNKWPPFPPPFLRHAKNEDRKRKIILFLHSFTILILCGLLFFIGEKLCNSRNLIMGCSLLLDS